MGCLQSSPCTAVKARAPKQVAWRLLSDAFRSAHVAHVSPWAGHALTQF